MLVRPCACGGTIVAPRRMDRWQGPVLQHARTPRHRAWSLALRRRDPSFAVSPPRIYEEGVEAWLGPLARRAS